MRKMLWIVSIMALLLVGADPSAQRLVKLTIVNKSGLPMEFRLTGSESSNFYYLHVPAGDRVVPMKTIFTIVPDTYTLQPYYIELWDPVYGYTCGRAGAKSVYLYRNIQITFLECGYEPRDKGEPSLVKYSRRWRYIY